MEGSLGTTQPRFGLPEEIVLQIFQDYLAFRRRELLARHDSHIRFSRSMRAGTSPEPRQPSIRDQCGRGQSNALFTIALH